MVRDILEFGADGITVHPRPDGRHIRRQDVFDIKKQISVELNIEGFPSDDFIALTAEARPAQVTLVPDPPEALTSNAGWNVTNSSGILAKVIPLLKRYGSRVSVFVEPGRVSGQELEQLKKIGCDRIELYTERYAEAFDTGHADQVVAEYRETTDAAVAVGLGINAGHDLNRRNLGFLLQHIPQISEVSIGHALICEALYEGMEKTIRNYMQIVRGT